jgi:RNA polymerase sigma-70 factor (ECF subfamily)
VTTRAPRQQEPNDEVVLDVAAVFDREFAYVWKTLRRFGVREADLPDQTQEVFIKLHELRGEYDMTRPLRPYLCAIAFRVAAGHRRRAHQRREVLTESAGNEAHAAPDASEQLERSEARSRLIEALEHVHDDRRLVLVMHDIDGTSMPDIVAVLKIPMNTGYSRLRLARQELAEAVRALREGREP